MARLDLTGKIKHSRLYQENQRELLGEQYV